MAARYSEQENVLENHINLLAAATRDIEKKSKALDLAKRSADEHVKVRAPISHTTSLLALCKKSEIQSVNFIC